MSQYIGGRLFSDAGQLQTADGSGGVSGAKYPAGMFPGWACDSTDKSYVYDLVASAVPAGAVFINGVAFTQAGVMYVSSDTPAASDVSINGFKVRQDGAVRASASAVGASDAFLGGWAVAQTGAVRMSLSDVTPPTLSAPSAGTPTTDGSTGAGVTTNEGNGTLYWAVVTNGGSCTDAQLKAGSGGNIVAGKAGNQAVTTTGAQTISTITGLTSSTTYQIKYLQRDAAGNDSSQASVSLTTTAAATIAFDAASEDASIGASPQTWTHTCTGANRILFVAAVGSVALDDVTGVTYNGVAMTQAAKIQAPGSRFLYLYYLINPASGANTVSVNGSAQCTGLAVSYTGANQTTQPDATNTTSNASANTLTTTVTTVADNAWHVGASLYGSGASNVGAGTTRRKLWSGATLFQIFDNNGPVTPAGSSSLISTNSGAATCAQASASFKPT